MSFLDFVYNAVAPGVISAVVTVWLVRRFVYKTAYQQGLANAIGIVHEVQLVAQAHGDWDISASANLFQAAILHKYLQNVSERERTELLDVMPVRVREMVEAMPQ
jgi:hypothetical protein